MIPTKKQKTTSQELLNQVHVAMDTCIQSCTASTDDTPFLRSSNRLDYADHHNATLLIMRSNAFANKGKFAEAAKHALEVIDRHPQNVNGYLTAGHVYAMQGKIQEAMSIYHDGLCVVQPSEWHLLYEKHAMAKNQFDQKVDFVSRLPVEMTVHVFTKLLAHGDTLIACTLVSKRWRNCLLYQCPELWRSIALSQEEHATQSRPETRLLFSISNHVQRLLLNNLSESHQKILKEMVVSGKFSSVRKVELVSPAQSFKPHMSLVAPLGRDVTSLRIMLLNRDHQISIELYPILHVCPNLKDLCLQTRKSVTYHPPSLANQYPLLELTIRATRLEGQLFELLLPQCPNLQMLNTYEFPLGAIGVIDTYCTRLRHFSVVEDYPLENAESSSCNPSSTGLYTLRYTKENTTIRYLTPLFIKSEDTLTSLMLHLRDVDDGVNRLAQLSFNHLIKLQLTMGQHHHSDIACMIQQCPTLQDVTLLFGGAAVTDALFSSLTTLSQLRSLTLSYIASSSTELERLFSHLHVSAANLQCITLKDCNGISDQVLRALANITSLRKIVMHYLHEPTEPGMMAFIQSLHTLSNLKVVVLDAMSPLTDAMLMELASIDGLLKLDLNCINGITSAGIRNLADRAVTLRNVNLFGCHGVDSEAKQYLKEKLSTH